jgi:hypothetical protein
MKTAFFLVLLANLTLLMYEYHRGAFEPAAEAMAPDRELLREPIVLAGEKGSEPAAKDFPRLAATEESHEGMQKPAEALEAAMPPPSRPELKPAFACYEAGPFTNDQILKTWSQAAVEAEGEIRPVQRSTQAILDYLVLYPTSGRREDIQAAMQTLRDRGIKDAYPLATGEYKGYISLGAFHRENRAERMRSDLQGRGIEPVVKPRFKETVQKYALLTGPAAIAERLSQLEKKYPMVRFNALPANDPNCMKEHSDRPEAPLVKPAESAAKQPVLPEALKAESSALPSGVAVAEKTPDKPVTQKTAVQPVPKPRKAPIEAKPAGYVCYEAGPFPNEPSLGAWQKQVAAAKGTIKPLVRDGKAISDYLVLYPFSGDKEAAKANMQWLHEHGIADAWPLAGGDEKGQISLGVFNREVNALQMQKSLLAKGVNSVVKPRYKNKRQKYALITGPESIADDLKGLEQNHPEIRLRRMPITEQNCSANHPAQP